MSNKLLLCFLFLFSAGVFAQNVLDDAIYSQSEVDICKSKFELAVEKNLASKPISEIITTIGKTFICADYKANALEICSKENLVISLVGLDCYTFLESSFAFARCIKSGKTTFEDYQKEILNLRYRDSQLKDYTSRLHYFTDWIYDMNRRGIGKDITKEIGGVPYKMNINFMSTHPDSYKRLKGNQKFIDEIIKIESEINSRDYFYIPQDKIENVESKIQSVDIIGIRTNITGLDISHTGIAYRADDGRIHLLHAPNVGYKVQISEKPLAEYIKGNKKQTGIIVLRPN